MSGSRRRYSVLEELSDRTFEASAGVFAPILLAIAWLAAKPLIADLILASTQIPVPLTNVSSIDCLFQFARCRP